MVREVGRQGGIQLTVGDEFNTLAETDNKLRYRGSEFIYASS